MDCRDWDGLYSVIAYGAAGDGVTDNTRAFQSALNAAGRKGGIVYVPPGRYSFDGEISVPDGVTLQGTFGNVPAHNGHRDAGLPKPGELGSALLVRGGAGREEGPAFLTLNTDSTLRGLLIYYPDQADDREPVPYPWTIAMRGKNPALLDTELLNSYNAVDATGNERHMIARVYGQPLRRGILIDEIYDIGRIEDVHFNPWWSLKKPVLEFMEQQGEAFIIGRTDWEYMINCFAIFYARGFIFDDLGHGAGNAVLTHCGHDTAPTTVEVRATQKHAGVSFSNCQFMGEFLVNPTNRGPVRLNGCGFWGTNRGNMGLAGSPSCLRICGEGHVLVNGCHFYGWDEKEAEEHSPAIDIHSRTATVSACDFISDKPCDIRIGREVQDCIILGNRFAGEMNIEKDPETPAQIGFNICSH